VIDSPVTEVSDILRERMQEPGGLPATALVSFLAHAAVLGAMIVGPIRWMSHAMDENKPVMTITLGGSGTGPENGGMTSIGARAVQTTEPATKPEALRAPAAKTPEMTVPIDKTPAKVSKTPPARATENIAKIPDARGKQLARGEEINSSPAVAVTGARGQGFGLSTGGGNGLSSTLEVGDFCCPDYIVLMIEKIRGNWNRQQEVKGQVLVKFTIQRDGRLLEPMIERGSGVAALDNAARRAVEVTRQLTPLPAGYTNPSLNIHLTFDY
jgi:TonB family protein